MKKRERRACFKTATNSRENAFTLMGFSATFMVTLIWLIRFRFENGIQDAGLDGDSGGIWQAALNLFRYQIFSSGFTSPPEPDAYLDFGMPFFLACAMWIHGDSPEYLPGILNAALLCVLACAGYCLVCLATKSQILAIVGGVLAATSWNATRYVHTALAETLVSSLLVLFLLGLYLLFQRQKPTPALTVGLVGGLLCLTRAPFLYVEIGFVIVLIVVGVRMLPIDKVLSLSLWVLLGFALTLGPFTVRNLVGFDQLSTNSRGGKILTIRTNFNQMSNEEWLAGFLYWNDDLRHLAPDDSVDGSPTRRLNRSYSGGFLRDAGTKQREYRKLYGEVEADKIMRTEALATIIKQPLQHLKVSVLVAWRGIAHRWEASERYGKFWPGWTTLFVLSIFFLVLKRRWDLLLLTVPLVGYIAFYAIFTHFIPRYGMILTPSFILIVMATVGVLIQRDHKV